MAATWIVLVVRKLEACNSLFAQKLNSLIVNFVKTENLNEMRSIVLFTEVLLGKYIIPQSHFISNCDFGILYDCRHIDQNTHNTRIIYKKYLKV